ncbi:hypothetical protein BJF84_26640 [Rhodococcus sp. CUA-806]|nr:hypothetical protein BJF84_26640 [Rhodococcus sp. CUA-806]
MAFSTTEDEQWFTALPADLTGAPDVQLSNADAAPRTDATGEEESAELDDERVVALPAPAAGPQWAAALDTTGRGRAQGRARGHARSTRERLLRSGRGFAGTARRWRSPARSRH